MLGTSLGVRDALATYRTSSSWLHKKTCQYVWRKMVVPNRSIGGGTFMTMMGGALTLHPWLLVLAVAIGFLITLAIKDGIDARNRPRGKDR